MPNVPHLAPLPARCLVDESLSIRVQGLAKGDHATVWLTNRGPDGNIWAASGSFVAGDGVVDLARDPAIAGSYAGVDGMGLFWSRVVTPASELPPGIPAAEVPGTVALTAQVNGGAFLPAQRVEWTVMAAGVTMRDVREQGLVGKLYLPAAQGSRPGVIVLGGSAGGLAWSREVAAVLASRGFAALALAYFGLENLPPTLDRIPLEYFDKALGWFESQSGVSKQGIGVCGVSRGAELALLLAATYHDFKAVVAYVPSGTVWCGVPPIGHSAWSHQGQEVPFAAGPLGAEWASALADGRARDDTDWYRLAALHTASVLAAEIAVEKIQGPLLLLSAQDDRVWPCSEFAEGIVRRCRARDSAHAVLHVAYPGAGHDLRLPHFPATVTRFIHPVTQEVLDMGGSPPATARARVDAWQRTLGFFRQHLGLGAAA